MSEGQIKTKEGNNFIAYSNTNDSNEFIISDSGNAKILAVATEQGDPSSLPAIYQLLISKKEGATSYDVIKGDAWERDFTVTLYLDDKGTSLTQETADNLTLQVYKVVSGGDDVAIGNPVSGVWNTEASTPKLQSDYTISIPCNEAGEATYYVAATVNTEGYTAKTVNSSTFTLNVTEASGKHTVKFDTNKGTPATIDAQSVDDGAKATKPTDPTMTGKKFYAWRLKDAVATPENYDFETPVTSDIELTALYVSTDLSGCYIGVEDMYTKDTEVLAKDVEVLDVKKGVRLIYGVDYTATIKDSNGNVVDPAKGVGEYSITVTGKDKFTGSKTWNFEISEDVGYFLVYEQSGIGDKVLKKTYEKSFPSSIDVISDSPVCALYNTSYVSVATQYVKLSDVAADAGVNWDKGSVLVYGSGARTSVLPYEKAENLKYYPDATANPSSENRKQIVKNAQSAPVVIALSENSGQIGDTVKIDGKEVVTTKASELVAGLTGNKSNAPRLVCGVDEQEYLDGNGPTLRGMKLWSHIHKITIINDRVDLGAATVAVADGKYTYNGKAFEPAVTVKLSDGTVVPEANYTVAYSNNVNAGKGTITVTGKLGAMNSKAVNFDIAKASSSIALENQTKAFNGKAQAYDGKVTKSGSAGAVSYKYYSDANCTKEVAAANVKNAGTYYVKATVAADANYDVATSAAVKLTINKVASSIKLATQSKTFTGKALAYSGKVTKTGSAGKVTYKYFSDAKCTKAVKAANVKKAGTYYVKATVAADANYNAATSAAAKFVIAKAKQPMTFAKSTKAVKYAKVKKAKQVVTITKAKKAQGKVTYAISKVNKSKKNFSINKSTGKITVKKGTAKGTYKVTVKATAKGNANYKGGSKTAVVTIKVK